MWIDRIQGCGATSAPDGELPLGIFTLHKDYSMSLKGEPAHNKTAPNDLVRRGDNYDGSGCGLAVKPRAFGAPQAALGLDRSAHPSNGPASPQCNQLT